MASANCIFCKIVQGSIPSIKVYETARILAFMDINPLSKGHLLVIPKTHCEFLHEMDKETASDLLPIAVEIAKAANFQQYNLLQNNGPMANQAVGHVHFHLIPKLGVDNGLCMSKWVTDKSVDQEAIKTFAMDLSKKMGQ